jgi:hypothetical protein
LVIVGTGFTKIVSTSEGPAQPSILAVAVINTNPIVLPPLANVHDGIVDVVSLTDQFCPVTFVLVALQEYVTPET